ncbi:MAG: HNH endonuclease [Nocardioides sp.]|nr:HNH endonuclease [Nocardioides sp.]
MPGVTVRPVIVVDLNEELHTDGYRPTPRQRRQAELTHETCAFPGCTVSAEDCDLDHRVPYDEGGPTVSSNLTPLCRKHHRAKTHLGWSYERLGPGVYLWHSPHGYRYLTSRDGTIDLTPDAGAPPTRRAA